MATYTGTGTQDDPYIVADWDSFVELCGTFGKYIKWAEVDNKFMDFNEIAPNGYNKSIQISAIVDFNNWTFRNLRFEVSKESNNCCFYFKSSSSNVKNPEFRNANFENMMIRANSIFYSASGSRFATVINTSMTGFLNKAGDNEHNIVKGYHDISNRPLIYSSSFVFDISGDITSFICILNWQTQDSYFKINYQGTGNFGCHKNENSINCLFKIKAPNATNVKLGISSYSTSSSPTYTSESHTCVYIIETPTIVEDDDSFKSRYFNSLFNSDLVDSYFTTDGLHPCTTEQMKDIEYLQSIGFPIGAV